jgi:hypothetical protein
VSRRWRPNRSSLKRGRPASLSTTKFAIEDMALRQQIKHPLETLHPVAVARDQPATNSVGGGPEFKNPIGMVERFCALDRVDQRQYRSGAL